MRQLVAAEPDNAELHRQRGDAQLRLAEFDAAVESYSAVLKLDAENLLSRFQRGRAQFGARQFEEALEDLVEVSKRLKAASQSELPSVDPAAVWLLRSAVQIRLDQPEKSEADFAHAPDLRIRLRPDRLWNNRRIDAGPHRELWEQVEASFTADLAKPSPPWWLGRSRGLARAALGRWPEAAADFKQATESKPDDAQAWHGLARALAETEPDSDAPSNDRTAYAQRQAEIAARLIELSPDDWSARRLRVRGLLASGQREAALVDLTAAIDLTDVSVEMRLLRGRTRLQLRQFEEAVQDFDRAVVLDPDNIQIRYLCAISSADAEQWDKATDHLLEIVRQVEERISPNLLYQLAQVSLGGGRQRDYRQACTLLVRIAEQTGDLKLANTAAWACALAPDAVENLDACVKLAKRTVAESPKSYPHLNTYGAILVRAGHHEEALKQLDASITAHGNGGTALDWLFQALAQQALGEQDTAAKLVQKAARWIEQIASGELKSNVFSYPLSWGNRVELTTLLKEAKSRTTQR